MSSILFMCQLLVVSAIASQPVRCETEVVVAHYHENLSWIDQFSCPKTVQFTIYTKGSPKKLSRSAKMLTLPNVGRESHTYLHHIVQNYDTLAPWTVFTQGARPKWGYQSFDAESGHLNSGVSFGDYLQPFPNGSDSMFVMTAASHFPSNLQLNRYSFVTEGSEKKQLSTRMCPDKWTPWWFENLHPHRTKLEHEPSMMEFYHKFVARDVNNGSPMTLAFAQGARFAVSRARILVRPREYYAALLDQVNKHINPIQGFWMEASWYDIFHPASLQAKHSICKTPSMPESGVALNFVDAMKNVVPREWDSQGNTISRALQAYISNASNSTSTTTEPTGGQSALVSPATRVLPSALALSLWCTAVGAILFVV